MYKKFSAPSTESLDSIFNRLQKIVSQLAILGENISQEDLNLKFYRSLPSEWNTHVVVWRNKPDLDTMSFDDLYNNFKIVEQEVKGTVSSSSSSQNMAFISSLSNTNEVNTAHGVSPASTQVSTASTQVSTANLNDDTVYAFFLALLSMRTRRFFQKTGRKITINGSDTAGYDKSKNQDSSKRTVNVEETSSKAMLAIDGAGFDWSYIADDEVPTNMALMAFSDSKGVGFVSYNVVPPSPTGLFSPPTLDLSNSSLEEFQQPKFEGYGPKTSKSVSEVISNEVRETLDALLVEELELNDKLEKKTVSPTKIEFVRPKQQEKLVKYAKMYMSQGPRGNQRNWNNQKSQQLGSNFVMYNKACFVCGSFDHVQANYNYHQRERVVSGNNYTRVNYNYYAKKAYPSAHRKIAPRAVLMKTSLRPLNTARPVNTAHHKTTVHSARPMSRFSKSAQSTVKKPYQIKTTLTNNNFSQKVNTTKGSFYTTRPKAVNTARIKEVNTARQNLAVVNDVMANQGHPQKISMNSMDDMLPLEEEQMEANLLMCDIKNNVLFTDTEYLVLSPNFKLPDESQILLRVPRKNNMYSVDMKNIVPKESLTCLVAKATLDESMLWHRRLGIRREFSMSRTPQQNGVAERRNRTLIEAARTMVLVVKPHIKTPYELFRGQFDGKSDEGFFVRYSMNSDRPNWLFDIDVLTKSMNYLPVVAGTNSNDFAGTEESIGTGHLRKETGSSQYYILMPLWKDGSLSDSSLKNASND
ncbi:ribonuclease H-like domain-containing protein, partial [Tanacetum coccineum]